MKVFVTGLGGWIGSQLAVALDRGNTKVAGIDRTFDQRPLPDSAVTVSADIRDPSSWRELLDGVDVVVHGAAVHHVDTVSAHPSRAIDINLRGTRAVLDAATAAGVPRFVFLSSAKVYGEAERLPSQEADLVAPIEPYGLAKAVSEQYVDHYARHHGLTASIVRPFSVYGPDQDQHTGYVGALIHAAANGVSPHLAGEPSFRRDFVYIDDVVDAIVALLDHPDPPSVVNVASGTSVRLDDAVSIAAQRSDLQPDVVYERPRPGTVTATHGSVAVLDGLLGRPPTQIASGLVSTLEWFERERRAP